MISYFRKPPWLGTMYASWLAMNLQVQTKIQCQGKKRKKPVENRRQEEGSSSVAQKQSTRLVINQSEVLVLFTKQYNVQKPHPLPRLALWTTQGEAVHKAASWPHCYPTYSPAYFLQDSPPGPSSATSFPFFNEPMKTYILLEGGAGLHQEKKAFWRAWAISLQMHSCCVCLQNSEMLLFRHLVHKSSLRNMLPLLSKQHSYWIQLIN